MRPFTELKVPLFFCIVVVLQIVSSSMARGQEGKDCRVAFWNFENFFDPFVDSTRVYNEFTENGGQHWTTKRFYRKRNNLYKAILSLSENEPLAVLGIAEIENRYVLNMLFNQTPLKRHNYRVIHFEGDDKRGIDVALVYCIDKMQLVYTEPVKVRKPDDKKYRTRDILYVKLYDRRGDTIHCFVNHWPSRYGGERETVRLRALAANTLRHKVDSLVDGRREMPKIIIMGDFNDTPDDPSIKDILCVDDVLVNLFTDGARLGFEGTLKHQYNWQIFDQIIVSKSLTDNEKGLLYERNSATIYHADFLFQDDESFGGVKLYRTYVGPRYFGGYSDHLPVYIDLIFR